MNRRDLLRLAGMAAAYSILDTTMAQNDPASAAFSWEEATIPQLQAAMRTGKASAESITQDYLSRIASIDKAGPKLNSIIELNPDALAIAKSLDEERKQKGPRGPLHGIPVLVKDNLDTHDRMMTTAGSLALLGSIALRDSFVVQRLREAGAVLLGKTNLSEWANFRGSRSTSGWSGRGGLTKNPYSLDRNPSGSSSGSAAAVSANLCAVAIGTETDGSIVSPSSCCGIVGIKPTVGLVSRAGIVPISATQDTAGPMARTVTDAAIVLAAIAGEDQRDPATQSSRGKEQKDYTSFLDPNGLHGARIGVMRTGFHMIHRAQAVMDEAVKTLARLGAEVMDPLEIPTLAQLEDAEFQVLLYEFKHGLNEYLASLGPDAPVKSLADVIEFNKKHADRELPYFGQEIMLQAQEKGPLTDKAYLDAVEKCRRLCRTEGLDAAIKEHHLDAIVAPTTGPASKTDLIYGEQDVGGSSTPAAVAAYPSITVPAGQVLGLPMGISFFGAAFSEPMLLKMAFAFEQATHARMKPAFAPSIR